MQHFDVPDMTCGHCVQAITQAVRALDPDARVEADLGTHRIAVATAVAPERLSAAIAAAGYANTRQP